MGKTFVILILVSKSKAATRSLFIVYGARSVDTTFLCLDLAALLSAPYAELSLPLSAADSRVFGSLGNWQLTN